MITIALEQKKKEYQIIDLNKENFNSVMTEGELALYSQHERLGISTLKVSAFGKITKRVGFSKVYFYVQRNMR